MMPCLMVPFCRLQMPVQNLTTLLQERGHLPVPRLLTAAFEMTDEQLRQENILYSGAAAAACYVRDEVRDGVSKVCSALAHGKDAAVWWGR